MPNSKCGGKENRIKGKNGKCAWFALVRKQLCRKNLNILAAFLCVKLCQLFTLYGVENMSEVKLLDIFPTEQNA